MKRILWALATASSLVFASAALAQIPDYVTKAVADPARAQDAANDSRRKVAELVAFSGAKPGDRVLDLIPGSGYFTRVFSKVVGPQGRVYAVWPMEYDEKFDKVQAIAAEYGNVDLLIQPAAKLTTPQPVDVVFTSQNYHDYHDKFMGPADLAVFGKQVLAALKPGGVFVVIDHTARAGSGIEDSETLHRIDPEVVKKEMTAAGFVFDGSSDALHNAADPLTAKVFDASIRGHTDQFIFRFRKPAK